jgi:sodium-independent sulfate anion transporter 11
VETDPGTVRTSSSSLAYRVTDAASSIDPGPLPWAKPEAEIDGQLNKAQLERAKPILRAVVFDFSGVSNIDTTSIQNLVDLRRVLERYAGGEVEFHFATILSPWIKRFVPFFPPS